MDIIQSLGPLAIASRLKRLSDRLMKDNTLIYQQEKIEFEPRWFPVFYLLWQRSPLAVTEIAKVLRVTHPAVNQVSGDLEKAGLVISLRDKADDRKRLLSLSQKGKELTLSLIPIWRDIEEAARNLLDSNAADLMGAMDRIENALDEEEMYARIQALGKQRRMEAIEILDFQPQYSKDFKRLNLEWLEKDFEVEPLDAQVLDDLQGQILRLGGQILFARTGGEVVGTVALIPREEGLVELVKMAVAEKARGRQIGKRLALAAIERARTMGATSMVLLTNPRLVLANRLYRQLGFVQITPTPRKDLGYKRPTIMMKLDLEQEIN